MDLPSRDDVSRLIEETGTFRRKLLESAGSRDDLLKALLKLAAYETETASRYIDCPYCRKHMLLESGEIARVLEWVEREGNTRHKHGVGERLRGLVVSVKIFLYVILGGLRRAGLI